MERPDRELIQAWTQTRDKQAFRQLYDRHAAKIYAFACAMLGTENAEEVVQETFLSMAGKLGQFNGHARLDTWLLAVARNAANSLGRKLARRKRDKDYKPPDRHIPAPSENIEQDEMKQAVRDAILALPEKQRVVVTLCELQDVPVLEAGIILGWPEGTVKSRLHRAREQLKKTLAEYMQ